ncbi:MAG: type III restriction endonuclease subunit R, partial [Cytophagaceae bacterium]
MPLPYPAQQALAALNARLSLRPPQRAALALLAELTDLLPPTKTTDLAAALGTVQATWPHVAGFDGRSFVSLCFALATGVGKTRLMGAFAAYLHRVHGVRHFFILAPNLTIYSKLIQDFTPGTAKYVFQGVAEFATEPPLLITGENYASSLAVRHQDLFGQEARVHVNIFNIAKLSKDAKAAKGSGAPRIKRLSEYLGQSYFDYLAGLDDLVLLLDESHRYRAEAGVAVLNELRPVLGLELTATPQTESSRGPVRFRNILYEYPLAAAIRDGLVKEPAVATRENFDPSAYSEAGLERLKLEDGLR